MLRPIALLKVQNNYVSRVHKLVDFFSYEATANPITNSVSILAIMTYSYTEHSTPGPTRRSPGRHGQFVHMDKTA